MRKIKFSVLIALLGTFFVCNAAEKVAFNDNDNITLSVSNNNINRFFIQNDSIVDLHVPEGAIVSDDPNSSDEEGTSQLTDKNGALYIQTIKTTPFTLYIGTEQGHYVGITVNPVHALGKTIQLMPRTASPQAATWEEKKGYEGSLIALMKAMMEAKAPKGYGMMDAVNQKSITVYGKGKVTPKIVYQGVHFTGVVSELCNEGSTPLYVEEKAFDREGIEAVSLSSYIVEPHQAITVYTVEKV